MTESLTERLQRRLASETAEIEALTQSELKKLGENLREQLRRELRTTENAIQSANETLMKDIWALRGLARWWWVALLLTWLVIGIYSVWQSMGPPRGMEAYQTFTSEGRTFLILPEGTEAMRCESDGKPIACVVLPRLE